MGYQSETEWGNHIAGYIGGHASRTIATEWGAAMGPGTKNGVYFDAIDHSIPSGSYLADYVRGVSAKLRELGMGSVYRPGLRDDENRQRSEHHAGTDEPSGLRRLRYSWGMDDDGRDP